MTLPVYIDIDGTLTDSPNRPNGAPVEDRLWKIRSELMAGLPVVIWSARGRDYAEAFIETNGLQGAIGMGKPRAIVDDNPDIRPRHKMPIYSPQEYFR